MPSISFSRSKRTGLAMIGTTMCTRALVRIALQSELAPLLVDGSRLGRDLTGQSSQAFGRIAHQPAVKSPSVDAVADRGVFDRRSVEHLPHGVVALLNHRQIHQRHGALLG